MMKRTLLAVLVALLVPIAAHARWPGPAGDYVDVAPGGVASGDICLDGNQLEFETGCPGTTYLQDASGDIRAIVDSTVVLDIRPSTIGLSMNAPIRMNGRDILVDLDADSRFELGTDDQIDIYLGGTLDWSFTDSSLTSQNGNQIRMGTGLLAFNAGVDAYLQGGGANVLNFVSNAVVEAQLVAGGFVIPNLLTMGGNIDLDGNDLILDADGDSLITLLGDDSVQFRAGGSGRWSYDSSRLALAAGAQILDYNGNDAEIDADGDSRWEHGTDDQVDLYLGGALKYQWTSTAMRMLGQDVYIDFDSNSRWEYSTNNVADLFLNDGLRFTFAETGLTLATGVDLYLNNNKLYGNASQTNWIELDDDSIFRLYTASAERMRLQSGELRFIGSGNVYIEGGALWLDADEDTSIDSTTDDNIIFTTGGAQRAEITSSYAEFNGSARYTSIANVTNAASPYTLAANDYAVTCDASSGSVTVDLPAAAGHDGRLVVLKKTDATGNACTLDGNLSETIDGATTQSLTAQYESYVIFSDGTEWWIR